MGDSKRVSIARFGLEQEALLACQRLLAEGFSPEIRGGPLFGVGSLALGPSGAFEVTVPGEEAASAQKLLAAVEREHRPEIPESVSAEEAAMPCPVCGSADKAYEAENAYNRYARSYWHSAGWFKPYTWRCVQCGHRW